MAYEAEVRVVEAAIEALKIESPTLAARLATEQSGAATGLEYYGITRSVFEHFLREKSVSPATASRLESGIHAVRRMYTS